MCDDANGDEDGRHVDGNADDQHVNVHDDVEEVAVELANVLGHNFSVVRKLSAGQFDELDPFELVDFPLK